MVGSLSWSWKNHLAGRRWSITLPFLKAVTSPVTISFCRSSSCARRVKWTLYLPMVASAPGTSLTSASFLYAVPAKPMNISTMPTWTM